MTEKQEKIIEAGLELFANEGYYATSTNKVAKKAGVSEGLIFRHFGNKEGLLNAILKVGESKFKEMVSEIIFESDPKKVLIKTFDMIDLQSDDKENMEFWKLQYKLKWETERYNEAKAEPLVLALSNAFEKLNYNYPKAEAEYVMVFIDGLITRYCLQENFDVDSAIKHFKSKYQL